MKRIRLKEYPQIESANLNEQPLHEAAAPVNLTDEAHLQQLIITNQDLSHQVAHDVLIESVLFRTSLFNNQKLSVSQINDSHFDTCQLMHVDWEKLHLTRSSLLNSRLTGLKLPSSKLEHVVFDNCQLDFSIFWSAELSHIRFQNCRLIESSFERATLNHVTFRNCDLSRTSFKGSKLKHVDLRGSSLEQLHIPAAQLKGTIIEPSQAITIAHSLGIQVVVLEEA